MVFSAVLGHQYRQIKLLLNINDLTEQLMTSITLIRFRHTSAERFKIILASVLASQMLRSMDLEESNRYATDLQNNILKDIYRLAIIDQVGQRRTRFCR